MFHRALGRAAAIVAAIALLSVTVGVTAAATTPFPQDFSFDERGLSASAHWHACTEADAEGVTRCESVDAVVFDGRQHNRDPEFGNVNSAFSYLCVSRYEESLTDEGPVAPPTSEGGCVIDPAISADGLDSLDVSATLDLVEEVCVIVDPETGETICEPGAVRTVSVDLAFTGIGETTFDRWRSNGTFVVDGVRCHTMSAMSGTGRDATASIVLDGEDLGPSDYAFMSEGRMRYAQRCTG
jgi:hypothetical protein